MRGPFEPATASYGHGSALARTSSTARADAAARVDARAEVEVALALNASGTRLLARSEFELAQARAHFDACLAGLVVQDRQIVTDALQRATGAHVFAVNFHADCRDALADAIDTFGFAARSRQPGPDRHADGSLSTATAGDVVAEATAVAAAAATVSHAAETTRNATAAAAAVAAEEVAASAAAADVRAQSRADELAALISSAAADVEAELRVLHSVDAQLAAGCLARLVTFAATATARNTAIAAAIVADSAAQAAARVATTTAATAVIAEQDVQRAAAAVVAAAREIAAVALRAQGVCADAAGSGRRAGVAAPASIYPES